MSEIIGVLESVYVGRSDQEFSKHPCVEISEKLASIYSNNAGEPLGRGAFSQAAKFSRGLVGVVEVAGIIKSGDKVTVHPYQPPLWLIRLESHEQGS